MNMAFKFLNNVGRKGGVPAAIKQKGELVNFKQVAMWSKGIHRGLSYATTQRTKTDNRGHLFGTTTKITLQFNVLNMFCHYSEKESRAYLILKYLVDKCVVSFIEIYN